MKDDEKAALQDDAALKEQAKQENADPTRPLPAAPLPEPVRPLPHVMCRIGADYPNITVGRMCMLILPQNSDEFIIISPDLGSMENVERFIRAAHQQVFQQQQMLMQAVPASNAKN